jgi:hypothetical protein
MRAALRLRPTSRDVDFRSLPIVVLNGSEGCPAPITAPIRKVWRSAGMAKYVLLYSGGSAGATETERQTSLQAWGAWFGKLGQAVADPGNPFSDKVKSLDSGGKVKDGPTGPRASGYSIVEAGSIDAATELAKGCPVLSSGGQITVYETFNAM